MELEEKIKQLQQEFSLPKVLIKTTLCGDDINGDLVKARQRLQEFQQINNRSDPPLKSPMVCNKPLTGMLEGSLHDSPVEVSDNKTGYQFEEQNRNVGVSGDTSFPPQTIAGLNPTPGNQRSIMKFGPSMKDIAFVKQLSLQISNNDQKLGKLSDSAAMRSQNTEIATTLATKKRRAPDPPKSKYKPNAINSNAHKHEKMLDAAKIRTQNTEIAKTPKRRAPDPPKLKFKPNVINRNAHKLGEVWEAVNIGKQNAEIAKIPKRRAPDPPKPKPIPTWRREPVSGDTSPPSQTTAGLNPTPGNQRSIKKFGPSMKDTAFVRELSLQISDYINNNDQKLGKLSDSATMRTQNTEIATTRATNAEIAKTPKSDVPDPPKPKSKPCWRREPVHGEVYKQNKAQSYGEEKQQLNERKFAESSSAIMDVQELEEKLKQLQEEFSLPKVLLKKILCGDDVNGDLVKARERLQEFKQIDNPFVLKITSPMANEPVTENSKRGIKDSSLQQWKPNNNGPEVLNAGKRRTQNAEIAENPKRNPPDPPKTKPKPNWRREPVHGEVYKPQNKAESYGEGKKQLNERKVAESSSANMDVQELEEKLKQLQEEFSLPKVLLKKTLCGDDVNGDLVKARERLQEFKQIDNHFVLKVTSPMANETVTENSKKSIKDFSLQQWKSNNNGSEHWVTMPRDERGNDVTVHLVDLEIMCSEYQDVAERFRQTVPSQNISSIARIQNPFLYQAYQLRKQKMDKDNEGDNERRLFHRTNPGNITKINTQGFDRSFSGSVNEPQNEGYKDTNKHYAQVHQQSYEQKYEDYEGDYQEYYEDDYEDDYEEDYEDDYEEDYVDDYEDDYVDDYEEDYVDDYEDNYDDDYEDSVDLMASFSLGSVDYEDDYGEDYEEGYDHDYEDDYDDDYEDSDPDLMAISPLGSPCNNIRYHFEDLRQTGLTVPICCQPLLQSIGNNCLERQHLTEENSKRDRKDSSLHQWKPSNNGPEHWVAMPRDERGNDVTVHLVDLEITCSEYQDVAKRFGQTVPSQNISSIARIQNPFLYQAYQLRKKKMDKDNEGNNERRLFHGTNSDNIRKINTQGFDRGFSGSVNGARYGTGVYFARDASYSKCYTSQIDVGALGAMYLARVLVGQYCEGSASMRKPPPKNPQQPEILFDSLVDNTNDPSIFVVYYDNQCYPEYLIRF